MSFGGGFGRQAGGGGGGKQRFYTRFSDIYGTDQEFYFDGLNSGTGVAFYPFGPNEGNGAFSLVSVNFVDSFKLERVVLAQGWNEWPQEAWFELVSRDSDNNEVIHASVRIPPASESTGETMRELTIHDSDVNIRSDLYGDGVYSTLYYRLRNLNGEPVGDGTKRCWLHTAMMEVSY